MALVNNGLNLQNSLLQTTLQNLWRGGQGQDQDQDQDQGNDQPQAHPGVIPNMPQPEQNAMTVNLHVHIDSSTASHFSNLRPKGPLQTRAPGLRRTQAREFWRETSSEKDGEAMIPKTGANSRGRSLEENKEGDESRERWLPETNTPETSQRALKNGVQPAIGAERDPRHGNGNGNGHFDYASARRGIMNMANSPLSASLLAALSERGEKYV